MGTPEQLINLIRELVKEETRGIDRSVICEVDSVNSDGTVNIKLLSDESTILYNIPNGSGYSFESGDYAVLYKIGNALNNAFIFNKVTNEPLVVGSGNTTINNIISSGGGGGTVVTSGVTSLGGASGEISLNGTLQMNSNVLQTATYIHSQDASSDTWNVKHNLNKYPSVTVIDSGDNVVYGDVKYIDKNNLQINFSAAFGGKAYLN